MKKILFISILLIFVSSFFNTLFSTENFSFDKKDISVKVVQISAGENEYQINGTKIQIFNNSDLIVTSLKFKIYVRNPTGKNIGTLKGTIKKEIKPFKDLPWASNIDVYYEHPVKSNFSFYRKPHDFKIELISVKSDVSVTVKRAQNIILERFSWDEGNTQWFKDNYSLLKKYSSSGKSSVIDSKIKNLVKDDSEKSAMFEENFEEFRICVEFAEKLNDYSCFKDKIVQNLQIEGFGETYFINERSYKYMFENIWSQFVNTDIYRHNYQIINNGCPISITDKNNIKHRFIFVYNKEKERFLLWRYQRK